MKKKAFLLSLSELVKFVFIALLFVLAAVVAAKLWAIFFSPSFDRATTYSFIALNNNMQDLLKEAEPKDAKGPFKKTFSMAVNDDTIGWDGIIIGFSQDYPRSGASVINCYWPTDTKTYKPEYCGLSPCLCLYDGDKLEANQNPDEASEGLISCAKFPPNTKFRTIITDKSYVDKGWIGKNNYFVIGNCNTADFQMQEVLLGYDKEKQLFTLTPSPNNQPK